MSKKMSKRCFIDKVINMNEDSIDNIYALYKTKLYKNISPELRIMMEEFSKNKEYKPLKKMAILVLIHHDKKYFISINQDCECYKDCIQIFDEVMRKYFLSQMNEEEVTKELRKNCNHHKRALVIHS